MHSQREGALKTQRIKSSFSRDAKNRLTRLKISDRASYTCRLHALKATHKDGQRFAASHYWSSSSYSWPSERGVKPRSLARR